MERRWGLGVEVEQCIGCYTCITACKMENGIPLGTFINRVKKKGPGRAVPEGGNALFVQGLYAVPKSPLLTSLSHRGVATEV
tara:strand:- start:204 stop:449 length:246 start_codon:yes stop_codon:yes gene_type:complete